MNSKHIRGFDIGRQHFHVTQRSDGTLQVSSLHPYDETNYHWAYQASKSCWHICREGKKVSVVASMDRVMVSLGANVVALVPLISPLSRTYSTASAYQASAATSEKPVPV